MQMMTAVNTIFVEKGKGEQVTARFQRAKTVHTFEGFIRMEVLLKQDAEDQDEVKVCTTWEDEKYFQNWLNSRENAKSHESKAPSTEPSPILGNKLTKFAVKVQHLPAEISEVK
ncbi:antibiotic biosynthesis monooxygenase [Mammaliicoccus sciuri]|uniref:Heme oxygenase (Staphylobilin-producing) n=1 Tax=Sporosarcina newyorkensis TaxID=759851 RepID=A0A1T4XZW8_9BACL|nr:MULTISPECIES: antibiotic biosynthesis monooxygenase [Sporosarcina]SKA95102.1 heme oxygenase (staphylobilin-producing) [Sporosarcina newyorkensis]